MSGSDYIFATATDLLTAMKERRISSLEITKAAIEQIERYDPMLNAMCVRDFERALTAAREADEARVHGDTRVLLGVPMTIKESFNIGGLPTTWGIPPFKEFTPKEDAVAVARVKSAGAVILGKTNVPVALADQQTYNPIYGTTNNPWNVSRTPGGSSGGSAAALAAGYGAPSIGSDIAGSLRVPAHCCGVIAHKPTFGLLPGRGHTPPGPPIPAERDLTVIGPMARSAADLALLFGLLTEPDTLTIGKAYRVALRDARHESLADYRVLVIDSHPCIPTSASVRTAINALAHHLDQMGAKVMRASSLLPDLAEGARIYMRLLMSSMSASLPAEIYERMRVDAAALDESDPSLATERTRGAVMSHRDWLVVDSHRAQLRERWRVLFSEFDVVLCPVMPTPTFHHDHSPDQWRRWINIDGVEHNYGDQLAWAGIATAPGLPATVLPVGRSDDGMPIGAQVIGPMYEDRTTLRFAALVEQELGGFIPPPLSKH